MGLKMATLAMALESEAHAQISRDQIRAVEVARLLGVTARAVRKSCATGRYRFVKVPGRNGPELLIELASLPESAQHLYWVQQIKARPKVDQRAYLLGLNLAEVQEREVARLAGVVREEKPLEPLPYTNEEMEQKGEWFRRLPEGMQEMANFRTTKLMAYTAHMKALPYGTKKTEATQDWCQENGVSMSVLYVWKKMVKNLAPNMWRYALAPGYGCEGRPMADFSEGAWKYILDAWGIPSQPPLKPIYRRAVNLAAENGWVIPSYSAVKKRVDDLPAHTKRFWREGPDALEEMYPHQLRDYSTIAVHEIWNADGRKADVHCRWPDGSVSRPMLLAWMDIRTRVLLGWAIAHTESAFLVMKSFGNAVRLAKTAPKAVYLDNGRAFASKQVTGGQATRNRFKVAEDDIEGLMSLLGCDVMWAKPYNGKAKPIESFWRTIATAEKRPEFRGAYCGNNPQNKPTEHDMKNAVPLSDYEAVVREEVEAYHQRPHRGDAMDGKSPHAVYAELMETTVTRYVTSDQLACCLMAAEKVMVNRSGFIEVMRNRYGCTELTALNSRGPYTARYDPSDASQPVQLFDGTRFVMRVPLVAKTGFADKEAAQAHNRARNDWKRAEKAKANAIKSIDMELGWMKPRTPAPEAPAQPLPTGKVVAPFKRAKAYTAPPMVDDPDEITPDYREKARIAREIGLANKVERAVESGALPPEYRGPRRMAGG